MQTHSYVTYLISVIRKMYQPYYYVFTTIWLIPTINNKSKWAVSNVRSKYYAFSVFILNPEMFLNNLIIYSVQLFSSMKKGIPSSEQKSSPKKLTSNVRFSDSVCSLQLSSSFSSLTLLFSLSFSCLNLFLKWNKEKRKEK